MYDNVEDINICGGICEMKGDQNCMMFELEGNNCHISMPVAKPMANLKVDDTNRTEKTIFVREGKKYSTSNSL